MFWMSFEDVLKNFYSITVCMVRHPSYNSQPWKEERRRFFFDYDRIHVEEDLNDTENETNEGDGNTATCLPDETDGCTGQDIDMHTNVNTSTSAKLNGTRVGRRKGINISGMGGGEDGENGGNTTGEKDINQLLEESGVSTYNSFRIISPLYHLNVHERGSFILSLHQEDIRCRDARPYIDTGLSILKVDSTYGTMQLVNGVGNTCDRDNQTTEFDLEPGRYLVVPFTSGTKLRQIVDDWEKEVENGLTGNVITPSSTTPVSPPGTPSKTNSTGQDSGGKVALVRPSPATGEIEFTQEVIAAYTELFNRLDLDSDGVLNKAELDQYMLRTEGSTIEQAAFQWLVHNFESKDAIGLSVAGFIRAQLYVFRNTGCNVDKLFDEFRLLGYDHRLQLRGGRRLTLAVHGTTSQYTLDHVPYDENASLEAQELVIVHYGEKTTFEDKLINLYVYRAGYYGVSILVENVHYLPLVFSLDCRESVNVISHRGTLIHTEMVAPNQRIIFHHLIPKETEKAWSYCYGASYLWDETFPLEEVGGLNASPRVHHTHREGSNGLSNSHGEDRAGGLSHE